MPASATLLGRDDNACEMQVPAVKQTIIAAEDLLLPSPPPDAGTRWSVSPTSTRLMANSLMRAYTSETTSSHVDIARGKRE